MEEMINLKHSLVLCVMFTGTVNADEGWKHFDCELQNSKHIVDNGLYKTKSKKFGYFDIKNEVSNLEIILRYNSKELRVYKLLGQQTHKVTEKLTESVYKGKVETTKKRMSKLYNKAKKAVGLESNINAEHSVEPPNTLDHKWIIEPMIDGRGRIRNLELTFSTKLPVGDKPALKRMKIFYSLKIPKSESDINAEEEKQYRYTCEI